MNRYGKIVNGKTSVKTTWRDGERLYKQVSSDECPEGFKSVERVLPYPTPTEGKEVAFLVTDCGDKLTKEGFLVDFGTQFAGRKFSKLSIYGAIAQLGAWDAIKAWLEAKNINGINGWMAFQLAQEISEDHPLFASMAEEARQLLGLTEEQFDALLNECILK